MAEVPAKMSLLKDADKGKDSILSIESDDMEQKAIFADPDNGELDHKI